MIYRSYPPLILASSSRYRVELLSRLRLPFSAISPDIDESPLSNETPEATALRLAQAKALTVAANNPRALVIGSDQVVELHGKPLGKPGNHANAVRQLSAMSAQRVLFHTALCLHNAVTAKSQVENVRTMVTLRTLTDAEIERYLMLDQPYDCAGSAKVECLGITLAESIDSSDPTALIGLPLIALMRMLRTEGVTLMDTR